MPYSKILFISCLFFIGSIFVLSSFFLRAALGVVPRGLPSASSAPFTSHVKDKFREIINTNLPNPQSAILSGILLGDKASFSHEWKQKMANTGTSHIVAVSGMNIVMLAQILVILGVALGFYRGQALWFSLILIWLFIALIGFQPSAIRAGIMGSILIVCQLLGRQNASFRALVLAVAIMLAINPTLLRYSLSFQLSVLATLGLIELSSLIKRKVHSEALATTLAAQVFTAPLLIYTFGYISLIGLPLNLLIVPIVPAIMILGIVFLLGALVYNPLGVVLSWPLAILLSLITYLIDLSSKIPFAILRF